MRGLGPLSARNCSSCNALVADHVSAAAQPQLAAGLRGDDGAHLLGAAGRCARRRAPPASPPAIDHQHAVHAARASGPTRPAAARRTRAELPGGSAASTCARVSSRISGCRIASRRLRAAGRHRRARASARGPAPPSAAMKSGPNCRGDRGDGRAAGRRERAGDRVGVDHAAPSAASICSDGALAAADAAGQADPQT